MTQARYEAGRDEHGKFTIGNQLSKGNKSNRAAKLVELKNLWYDATSVEELAGMIQEFKEFIRTCPIPEVKAKAFFYFFDRSFGKPSESVDIAVSGNQQPLINFNLSSDEQAVIDKILNRISSEPAGLENKQPILDVPASLENTPMSLPQSDQKT